jgi:hypothetical protein
MACGCGKTSPERPVGPAFGTCEVCARVRGDTSAKPVRYCHVCRAWICSSCAKDWPARAKAAFLAHVRRDNRA